MAAELAPGKWDMESSDNFDNYMKALGVGFATRLVGNQAKPRQEVTVAPDGTWTIKTSTALSSVEIKFKPGQPFEEKTADGRVVQTTCTLDGNKLIQEQKGSVDSTIIRNYSKENFVMTLKAKDVVCTRKYKKVV